jgi:hypothetical protein
VTSPTPGQLGNVRARSRALRRAAAAQAALRPPVRPLDDGTTELVRVIEFVLPAGSAIQPVLWLERQLLD